MINVLMSNFFSRKGDEDFFDSLKNWTVLGLNWMESIRYMQLQKKGRILNRGFRSARIASANLA
jgi:hypothetical protein